MVQSSGCRICLHKPCRCDQILTPVPTPVPPTAPICFENHTQTIVSQSFATSICFKDLWDFPAVGETVDVEGPELCNFVVDSYLWNPNFGYVQLTAYDSGTFKYTLKNNGQVGNANEGAAIPPCTCFVIAPAPCCDDFIAATGFPYVAEDFLAPAEDVCIEIAVTSIATLFIGEFVHISSGTYFISDIPDGTHILICNQGGGVTPGTNIIAKDGNGSYQFPITEVLTPVCEEDPIPEGSLVVCGPEGETTLDGSYPGQVPFLTDSSTNTVVMAFPDTERRVCVLLLSNLDIVTGNLTYVLEVADTSGFDINETIEVNFLDTYRFNIDLIPDGTHLNVTIDPVPAGDSTVSAGTYVCKVLSREELQTEIDEIKANLKHVYESDFTPVPTVTGTLVVTGTTQVSSDVVEVVVQNPSTLYKMLVSYDAIYVLQGATFKIVPLITVVKWSGEAGIAIGPIGTTVSPLLAVVDFLRGDVSAYAGSLNFEWPIDIQLTVRDSLIINPGDEARIRCRGILNVLESEPEGYTYQKIFVSLEATGVAITPNIA